MLIISQNATDYDLNFPKDAILRINLAWCNSLDELEIILKKNSDYGIFIDLPILNGLFLSKLFSSPLCLYTMLLPINIKLKCYNLAYFQVTQKSYLFI